MNEPNDEPTPEFNFQPEVVRPPENAIEWYECVAVELAWRHQRSIDVSRMDVRVMLQALVNRGTDPQDAADAIFARFLVKV